MTYHVTTGGTYMYRNRISGNSYLSVKWETLCYDENMAFPKTQVQIRLVSAEIRKGSDSTTTVRIRNRLTGQTCHQVEYDWNLTGGSSASVYFSETLNRDLVIVDRVTEETYYDGFAMAIKSDGAWQEVNIYIPIPFLPKYTISLISYSGTSVLYKYLGTDFYLPSRTRDGYRFKEWNTKEDGTGTSYSAGQAITQEADLRLYAIWRKTPTISISDFYRCNSSGTKTDGGTYFRVSYAYEVDSSIVSGSKITVKLNGYSFNYNLSSSSGTTSNIGGYANLRPGGSYNLEVTITDAEGYSAKETMVVKVDYYTPPVIGNLIVYRCQAGPPYGIEDDEGTYCWVEFDWTITDIKNASGSQLYKPTSVTLKAYSNDGETLAYSVTIPQSSIENGVVNGKLRKGIVRYTAGTSGGTFDTETQYKIEITINDPWNSAKKSDSLTTAFFTLDFLGDAHWDYSTHQGEQPGHGASFGSPAKHEGLNISMKPYHFERESCPVFFYATKPDENHVPCKPCVVIVPNYIGWTVPKVYFYFDPDS